MYQIFKIKLKDVFKKIKNVLIYGTHSISVFNQHLSQSCTQKVNKPTFPAWGATESNY